MVFIGFTEFVKIRWSKVGIEALFLHGNWEKGLHRRQAFEKVPLPTLSAFDNNPRFCAFMPRDEVELCGGASQTC